MEQTKSFQNIYHFDRLHSPAKLYQNQCLLSSSKNYYLIIQSDGRLKIYVSSHFTAKNEIYNISLYKNGVAPFYLKLNSNARLAIYDYNNDECWNNGCEKKEGHYIAILQNNGNLEIHDELENLLWESESGVN